MLALAGLAGFGLAVVPALGKDESIGTSGTSFTPDSVTIDVGDTVTVSNTDGGNHNLHWDDRMAAEQLPGPSWTSNRTFDQPGTYTFACDVHRSSGMTGTVVVKAPSTPAATTTSTSPTTSTATTPATTTDTTPTATPAATTTTTTPTQTAASRDTRAPTLRARAGTLRRRLAFTFSVTERSRIVATIRGKGLRTTVRFVLVPGNRKRVLLRHARPGRYVITLRATDEAGNRSPAVRRVVRVRP